MAARSAAATVGFFESAVDSPTPMLMTILSSFGICISLAKLNFSCRAPRMRSTYSFLSRGSYFLASAIDHISRTLGHTDLLAIFKNLETDAGRLAILVGDSEVGKVD